MTGLACTAAVIGGGPAGLMAAEVLAAHGVAVTVYEQMPSPGRKLQLAGRGGLNLTHSEPLEDLLERYGPARSRLAPSIRAFGPSDLRAWAAGLGQNPFVGTSGRVFPAGFRATGLLRAWLRRLDDLGVQILVRHRWLGWDDRRALLVAGPDGEARALTADVAVLTLGGASWPRTGSDGCWVDVVRAAGIEVVPLRPANSGFTVGWSPPFRHRFAGTPVKNVAVRGGGGGPVRGELLITETGIEGGAVYALSSRWREALAAGGDIVVHVDLRPDLTEQQLAARLRIRRPGDSQASWLRRSGFVPVSAGLLREATGNALPSDPGAVAGLAKALPITLTGTEPLERAISTAGGIALGQIDAGFMLRDRPGTFVAGEMLDWEAPTGGYLLQATFSSAVAAATGALAWLNERKPAPLT